MTMDEGFGDFDTLTGLAFSMRSINPDTDVTFATAPVMADPANPKVTVVFSSKASSVWKAIIADQPIAPLLDDQSDSPANAAGASPVEPTAGATEGGSQAASEDDILNACSAG
jgi:hypothetical protein